MSWNHFAGAVFAIGLDLCFGWVLGQTPMGLERREPAVEALVRAGRIADASERETALRVAVAEALLGGAEAQQRSAYEFLTKNAVWIDPRPFSGILEEYGRRHPELLVELFLESQQLLRAPREERMAIYLRAVRDGAVTLSGGSKLTRAQALDIACGEGMVELKSEMIRAAGLQMAEGEATGVLSECLVELELTDGAESGLTAYRAAAAHLTSMPDDVFRGRVRSDPVFRLLIENHLRGACVRNPFTGQTDPACCEFAAIARRQVELDRRLKRDGLDTPIPTPADPRQMGNYVAARVWLDTWQSTFQSMDCYKADPPSK